MDKEKLFEIAELIVDEIGETNFIEQLLKSLPAEILEEHLEFAARCYEVDYDELKKDLQKKRGKKFPLIIQVIQTDSV